jgi:hypothetical protein
MNDAALNVLRSKVAEHPTEDKVLHEKRLKAEILQLRAQATIVREHKRHLTCEGGFGRVVVDQKEATLYDLLTNKPVRNEPFKSHLYAVHRALCWSVLGMYQNRFGNLQ